MFNPFRTVSIRKKTTGPTSLIPRLNGGEALELELKPTITVQVVEGKIAFNLTCGNTLYVSLFPPEVTQMLGC